MVKRFGFGKDEKLKSRKQIDHLFEKGRSFSVFPIRVTYLISEPGDNEPGVKAGVTVSKKYFKKAVDRNRIKRLLREAYRLQKQGLKEKAAEKKINCFVFFMYTEKTILSYQAIKEAMSKCIFRLEKTINENHP